MAERKITEVATITSMGDSDSFFVNTDDVLSQLEKQNVLQTIGGVGIERLWQNPDYTQSFAQQDISADLSKYQFVIVFFRAGTTYSGTIGTLALKGYESRAILYVGGGTTVKTRSFYPQTSNKITMYDAYTGSTTDNTACIPISIYGVKGVVV